MKAIKVKCKVCEEEFKLHNGNYFIIGINNWDSIYIHKECKFHLEIKDEQWTIKQKDSNE